MDNDRDPNCHIGYRHMYAREILREDARTEQLTDAVPDKKARHQQASERRQVSFEIVHGAFFSILLLPLSAACAEPISRPKVPARRNRRGRQGQFRYRTATFEGGSPGKDVLAPVYAGGSTALKAISMSCSGKASLD